MTDEKSPDDPRSAEKQRKRILQTSAKPLRRVFGHIRILDVDGDDILIKPSTAGHGYAVGKCVFLEAAKSENSYFSRPKKKNAVTWGRFRLKTTIQFLRSGPITAEESTSSFVGNWFAGVYWHALL